MYACKSLLPPLYIWIHIFITYMPVYVHMPIYIHIYIDREHDGVPVADDHPLAVLAHHVARSGRAGHPPGDQVEAV